MKITIINSKGHWIHGWFTSPSDLQTATDVLQKAGILVKSIEVESTDQLERTLDGVSPGTLIWSNAYFVNNGDGKIAWLNEFIERRGLPFIGSGAAALQRVLKKDLCQSRLKQFDLPIPSFLVISRENLLDIENLVAERNIGFPQVLKPTSESGSIGVCMAKDLQETKECAHQILKDFPHSNIIIEEFLPSDDITCGYLQLGSAFLLLPTSYMVKSKSGKNHILTRQVRLRSWDDVDKMQPPITDASILKQLKETIPVIAKTLNINGITRIDGRLDHTGKLRFFDVNGLPALCFPDGVMVKQCISCFPDYDQMEVFVGLIHTIVKHALLKHHLEIPEAIQKHNLFTMQSEFVIRGKIKKGEMFQKPFILSRPELNFRF